MFIKIFESIIIIDMFLIYFDETNFRLYKTNSNYTLYNIQ